MNEYVHQHSDAHLLIEIHAKSPKAAFSDAQTDSLGVCHEEQKMNDGCC